MSKNKKEILLDKFYEEYNLGNYVKAISCLIKYSQFEEGESFWVYSRLSSAYYELKRYKKALFYAEKAYALRPQSPLVLWDYAGVLIMSKKEREAIKILSTIIEVEDDLTHYGFADPDIRWMKSLKIDAHFQIGKAYYIISEDELAKKFFLLHLSKRTRGVKSLYSKQDVLRYVGYLNTQKSSKNAKLDL